MPISGEARDLAAQKAAELAALAWDELGHYEPHVEEITLPSGHSFRVRSDAGWDMDAWQSDLRLTVKVYATRGWRRYWPVTERALRRGEDMPARSPSSP